MNSLRGRELFSYLPAYYETSRVMQSDMDAKGSELDALYQALNSAADQFFVRTATWGLERWEMRLASQLTETSRSNSDGRCWSPSCAEQEPSREPS